MKQIALLLTIMAGPVAAFPLYCSHSGGLITPGTHVFQIDPAKGTVDGQNAAFGQPLIRFNLGTVQFEINRETGSYRFFDTTRYVIDGFPSGHCSPAPFKAF